MVKAQEWVPTEDQEQEMVIQFADRMFVKYPGLNLLFAIPNGGYRYKATAAKLQRTGERPGVPDLFLPVPRGKYHGMFIEMKRRKGGKLSDYQRGWIADLTGRGYKCVVALGADDAIKKIEEYYEQGAE